MKLLTRYNRINITLMAGIFILASVAYYWALYAILLNEVDESLDVAITKIDRYINARHTIPQETTDLGDDLIATYQLIGKSKVYSRKRKHTVAIYNSFEKEKEKYRSVRFCRQAGNQYYEISVARPLEGTTHLLMVITAISVLTLFLMAVTATLSNRVIFRRVWQPFYQSLSYLKSYKVGSVVPFVLPDTDTDEFSTMNAAMEHAMNKAGEDYHSLKEFTENASHEMQTPLAIIRSKLDLLTQESDFSEKQSELLQSTQASIQRLSKLNKSLLLLAKIENHQFDQVITIHLEEKLEDKVSLFKEIWENEHINVQCFLSPATLRLDASLCDILLNNLLSNAVHHNYEGGTISLLLKQGTLSISNTSHSPAANKKQLFKRFYKAQTSSTRHGLGLSIVREICDLNNIRIDYDYENGQHTFTLNWNTPATT